jgi:acyl dehydratase
VYFEDYTPGLTHETAALDVTAEAIVAFAREFDPQPFHLSEEAGRASIFGGLIASGWHTCALAMKLFVESDFAPTAGSVGMGVDNIRWPRPVRPGDRVRLRLEVVEMRVSASRQDMGLGHIAMTMINQDDEPVLGQVARVMLLRRRADQAS